MSLDLALAIAELDRKIAHLESGDATAEEWERARMGVLSLIERRADSAGQVLIVAVLENVARALLRAESLTH